MLKKIATVTVYVFAIIGFVLTAGYFAVRFGLTNSSGIVDRQRENFLASGISGNRVANTPDLGWNNSPEWDTLKQAVLKDKPTILRAARDAGVPTRLIVSELIVEQLRFYTDDRESFKKFFEPLKILGSQSKFSWGVMGIKEETAVQIENHLKDPTSPYYLGEEYAHLLDFKIGDMGKERFSRMTDQHNHYWSYLYAGLYLHEVLAQWRKAGYPIENRVDILSTLYNIGFKYSVPKENPLSGGAPIPIGNAVYSFGSLASEFYNSNEMIAEFPR